jgi:hypothetical protein
MLKTSEASAKAGPGVLLGREPGSYSKFTPERQLLAERFSLSLERAAVVLSLMRWGCA